MKNRDKSLLVKNPLGNWTAQDFIQTCWQREPLLVAAAMPDIREIIGKKDLIAIACEPGSEARLVLTDAKQKNWQCEQGPFKAKHFKSLPASHWTLLVQAVDQWMPVVAGLLKKFEFLPRWRLDDIMISYATQGGGVGPHFDHYDVFLLQASGKRRWKIGQRCDEQSVLRDHPDMKLLKQFKTTAQYDVETGDVLYIPSGVAHWGTATSDDCITISIGFRAASHGELLQMALNKIASQLPESQRYRDTTAAIDADPFCINAHAAEHVLLFFKNLDAEKIKQALAQALGEYATEPRYPDHIDAEKIITMSRLNHLLHRAAGKKQKYLAVKHHPASRFAYRPLDSKRAELYVDGETHYTSLKLAQAICHLQINPGLMRQEKDKQLLLALVNQGSLLISASAEMIS